MNNMKICILTTSYPRYAGDYAGIFVHNLAKELVKNDVRISVIAPHDVNTKDQEFIDGVEIYRFQYWFTKKGQKVAYGGGIPRNLSRILLAKFQLIFFMVCFFFKGLRIAKKCDIIHAEFLPSGYAGLFIKKLTGKKLIITAHGSDIYTIPKQGFFKKMLIEIISHSDSIITVSNENKKRLINLGLKEDFITVIPNGVYLSMIKPKSPSKMKSYGSTLIWIGRMVEVKGLEYLLKATKRIIDIYPESQLMLVGDGPLKNSLENFARILAIDKNITFVGAIANEEIPKYLEQADIFVITSLSEGFPTVIPEAMAAGKPIIASDVGGISDAVKDGINGFLVKPRDVEQLAEKISYLILHPEERITMGNENRKSAEENYTWENIAKNTLKIYRKILRENRK